MIELAEAEALALLFAEENGSDQVAGDHKEYIYADESSGEPVVLQVEEENGEHRNRSKAVDGGTILDGRRRG